MIPTCITNDISELGKIIAKGGIVVFPTETVYGIGASSTNFSACEHIYKIKNRPLDNPLIAHFDSIPSIGLYCQLTPLANQILETFSPGPITVVLKRKNSEVFTLGLETIAVRIPGHEAARSLITASGTPISAPSANLSGKPSFTRERDVIEYFSGKVDGILLGSPPSIGIESTVIDLSSEIPFLLRPGLVTAEQLRKLIPHLEVMTSGDPDLNSSLKSPGMKYRHYSPDASVIILTSDEFKSKFDSECRQFEKVAFMGFNFVPSSARDKVLVNNRDYMRSLFAFFVDSDLEGWNTCYCEMPKDDEYFPALMNRLQKAANKT